MLQLSVLDQSPIPEGSRPGDALRNTIDLARHADQWGYARYWLAEHHGTPGLAGNSPEVIIGPVAAATNRIRVGSGGVMLPHYSALKVAENFSMLSGLYPNRIDLGLGRAPGSSAAVAWALQRDKRHQLPDDFQDQLLELLGYFGYGKPDPRPFRQLPDIQFERPAIALLGSSPQSAAWAGQLGLPYVFADFINPEGAPLADYYRESFQPGLIAEPRVSVCCWAVCADTKEQALRLSSSARMMLVNLFRGRPIAVPSVEKAMAFLEQENAPIESLPAGRRMITGDPPAVHAALEAVAEEYGAGEAFVVNIVHDHAARLRSYELIARAFELC